MFTSQSAIADGPGVVVVLHLQSHLKRTSRQLEVTRTRQPISGLEATQYPSIESNGPSGKQALSQSEDVVGPPYLLAPFFFCICAVQGGTMPFCRA
jgi:hypothetical protein